MRTIYKLLIVCGLLVSAEKIWADDLHWKAPVSGSFGAAGSWQPAGPPQLSDTAIFDLGSAGYTVTTLNDGIGKLRFGNDTLTLGGFSLIALEVVDPAIQLGLNSGDVSNVTLQSMLRGHIIEIGAATESTASLVLNNGTLSTEVFPAVFPAPPPGQIVVGAAGNGTLTINSGTATSDGTFVVARDAMSQGNVIVSGGNATLEALESGLTVGAGGNGTLSVLNRGTAYFEGALVAGASPDAVGNIQIDGAGSELRWQSFGSTEPRYVTLGAQGEGSLSITGGGSAQLTGPLVLGESADALGTILVSGNQSKLLNASGAGLPRLSLTVGAAGEGRVTVADQGTVTLQDSIIVARDAGSLGTIVVDGAGSNLKSVSMNVGHNGDGTLKILQGGHVDAALGAGDFAGAHGSVIVDGSGSVLQGYNLGIGFGGTGMLSATSGAAVHITSSAVFGSDAGATGSAVVDGSGSTLTASSMVVGDFGTGDFRITGGASTNITNQVEVGRQAGSHGSIVVDGAGSQLTFDQLSLGNGTADVTGGGAATAQDNVSIAPNVGNQGKLTISGTGSQFTVTGSHTVTVGQKGQGELLINQGGMLLGNDASMIVGAKAGSQGMVTVAGPESNLSMHGLQSGGIGLYVADSGTATLKVEGGATVDTGPVIVGNSNNSNGTILLNGTGTQLSALGSATSYIGYRASGRMAITNGATFSSSRTSIGYYGAGAGTVEVDGTGSLWTSSVEIDVHDFEDGLSITNGARVAAPTLQNSGNVTIDQLSTFHGNVINESSLVNEGTIEGHVENKYGTLSGSGSITGTLTQDGGRLAPGNSPGTMQIGALDFQSGRLELEINRAGGIAGGPLGWDLVDCAGSASLYGLVTIDLISLTETNASGLVSDFDPLQNYQWTFLTSSGISYFNPYFFTINTSQFTNPIDGVFSVVRVGDSLALNYRVPEPATYLLAGIGLVAVVAIGRSGRRRHRVV